MDVHRERDHARGTAPSRAGIGGWSRRAAVLAVVLMTAAACSEREFGFTDPGASATATLNFEVPGASSTSSSVSSPARAVPGVSADVTVSDDPALTVDSVDVVIREVQIAPQGTDCAGGAGDEGEGSGCQEFIDRTFVPTLPVDAAGAVALANLAVPPATYDQVTFRFNVLDANEPRDAEILSDRGELRGASVFVVGTFRGDRFELKLDPTGEMVVPAGTPLTLDEEQSGDVVLVWDVGEWFLRDDGSVIDPVAAQGDAALKDDIEANLTSTLRVRTQPPQ